MPFLTAAVVLAIALGLVNLVLLIAVMRRVAGTGGGPGAGGWPLARALGDAPGDFTATTVDGDRVDRHDGTALIGFFSPDCSACGERVAPFRGTAAALGVARDHVLAVVAGDDAGTRTAYLPALAEVARVVVEPHDGPVSTAFGIPGYPVFVLLDAVGVIAAAAHDPDDLSLAVRR